MSLTFHPLYWVYHDCWKWEETIPGYPEDSVATFHHAGHIHFFFESTNFNADVAASGSAYGGTQLYRFRLNDIWGPNSDDPNQAQTDKLIGKPIWYFYVEEYWRRVYVQSWQVEDSRRSFPLHPGKSGIKYDASLSEHSLGPFREGGGLYFFNSKINRTLPVEYWKDKNKRVRDLFVKKDDDNSNGGYTWDRGASITEWYRPGRYVNDWVVQNDLDNTRVVDGITTFNKKNDVVYVEENGARKYYKYKYTPYNYDYLKSRGEYPKSERRWPNPPPNIKGDDLWPDYLGYYNFNLDTHGASEYDTWCAERELDYTLPSSYRSFISTKIKVIETHSLYENLTFEDYGEVWEEITDDEEILDLIGDFPRPLKVFVEEDGSVFDTGSNPFVKDGIPVNPYEVYKEYFERREIYALPREGIAKGDFPYGEGHPRERSYSDEDGARRNYLDEEFIYPVMEYQKVIHLNYERLPDAKEKDKFVNVYTDKTGNFGDGFEMTIELPFRKGYEIQSPFSTGGLVSPIGVYHHGVVKEEDKLRYKVYRYNELDDVKKFMNHKYLEFVAMRAAEVEGYDLTDDEWFEANWKDKPILRNKDEGTFYSSDYLSEPVWMPYLTQQFITEEQIDNEGYVNSSGELIVGEGKLISFSIPEGIEAKQDGVWVEQCLGGIVKAEVEVVLEDPFGNRRKERVSIVAANSVDTFEGVDKANQ